MHSILPTNQLLSLNFDYPAHVVQAADDGRMHALVFDKVAHRVVDGQSKQAAFLGSGPGFWGLAELPI